MANFYTIETDSKGVIKTAGTIEQIRTIAKESGIPTPVASKFLGSDTDGVAVWKTLPAANVPTASTVDLTTGIS